MPHGKRSRKQRLRQLRANARPRKSVRHRLTHAAECGMHQRHADVRRADAPISREDRGAVQGVRFAIPFLLCIVLLAQDWPHYGGDAGETHYSALDQINRTNVRDLELAWEWKPNEEPLAQL